MDVIHGNERIAAAVAYGDMGTGMLKAMELQGCWVPSSGIMSVIVEGRRDS